MADLTAKQVEALKALEKTNGSFKRAAQMLGIAQSSLGGRVQKIRENAGIDPLSAADRKWFLDKIGEQVEREAEEEKKPFKKCKRPCKYRSGTPALNGCDFFYLTQDRRGCPAGEDCTRFEEGERIADRFEYGHLPRPDAGKITRSEVETYTRQQRRRHLDMKALQGK